MCSIDHHICPNKCIFWKKRGCRYLYSVHLLCDQILEHLINCNCKFSLIPSTTSLVSRRHMHVRISALQNVLLCEICTCLRFAMKSLSVISLLIKFILVIRINLLVLWPSKWCMLCCYSTLFTPKMFGKMWYMAMGFKMITKSCLEFPVKCIGWISWRFWKWFSINNYFRIELEESGLFVSQLTFNLQIIFQIMLIGLKKLCMFWMLIVWAGLVPNHSIDFEQILNFIT